MKMLTTIRVTDAKRAAVLKVAVRNKQVTDVVDEDGDTVRGRVLALHRASDDGASFWIALVEVPP